MAAGLAEMENAASRQLSQNSTTATDDRDSQENLLEKVVITREMEGLVARQPQITQ